MTSRAWRHFVTTFVAVWGFVALVSVQGQNAQQNAADAEQFVRALEIRAGTIVGEIGAGGGELTVAIARTVGDGGRVYSTELNKDRLAGIAKAVEEAGLKNVTVVEARENETNLPPQCCDVIFMRNVYHHFADPPSMNASLFASLRPGGRLAVMDFGPPPGAESENPAGRDEDGHHGVTAATVERELKAAGFDVLSSSQRDRSVMVVARRPDRGACCDAGHSAKQE